MIMFRKRPTVFTLFVLLFCSFAFGACLSEKSETKEKQSSEKKASMTALEPYVQDILRRKGSEVVKEIEASAVILEMIDKENNARVSLSDAKIEELDTAWRSSGGKTALAETIANSKCSAELIDIQQRIPGVAEIFLTCSKGLNVCQSNATSDLLQADEDWWQRAAGGGHVEVLMGGIEYDESSMTEAVPIFFALRNESDNTLRGVGKVVIELDEIKQEL